MFNLTRLLDPKMLITMAMWFLTSLPVHEWAHAWTAFQLGDDTAARRGRLTINPLAHIDLYGAITLLLAGFGWGKPVPVAPYRLRGNRRASWALVSAAGPFSNFVLAMLAAIPFQLGVLTADWSFFVTAAPITIESVIVGFVSLNLSLMIFNLIPIPPLDGSRILAWVLPGSWADALDRLERFAGPGLLMVLFLLSRLGVLALVTSPAIFFLIRALIKL